MRTFKIRKENNPIYDVCLAYGLYFLLESGEVTATIRQYPAFYVVETEDFDTESFLETYILDENLRAYNLQTNKMCKLSERNGMLEALFEEGAGFFQNKENVRNGLAYFETLDEKFLKAFQKRAMSYVGSPFHVKGKRQSDAAPSSERVETLFRYLSAFGYMQMTSFTNVGNNARDITWIPIPSRKGATDVEPFDVFHYTDNETGESKLSHFLGEASALIGTGRILLKIQEYLNASNISEEYDGIYLIETLPAGQRALNDKITFHEPFTFGENATRYFKNKLNFSDTNYDLKRATAFLLLQPNRENLRSWVHISSKLVSSSNVKRNDWVSTETIKEIITVVEKNNRAYQDIFEAKSIQKFGNTLHTLLYNRRGFEIQAILLSAHTKRDILKAYSLLNRLYRTYYTQKYKGAAGKSLPILFREPDQKEFLMILEEGHISPSELAMLLLMASNQFNPNIDGVKEPVSADEDMETTDEKESA